MNSGDGALAGHPFVVAHRGASGERPEHTLAAYELALQEGADGVECDVRLTRDGHLVCVHDRKVDRTSNGTGLVSEMTLAQLRELDYGSWHPSWPADGTANTGLLTLDDLVALVLDWNRPVKLFIETKHPVRYGALVESKVLALLHRYGVASPASADLSRAVVMSFSAAAVWRIRRAAPMLPTVLLGETSGISAAAPRPPSALPRSGRRSRLCGSIPNWWTGPRRRVGRCTAGPSTTTRTSGTAATSASRGWRRTTPAARRAGCRTA